MNARSKKRGDKREAFVALLHTAGLRPTQQRLALAKWLFSGCPKHTTVAEARAAARKSHTHVSLATIYNMLNDFSRVGLLRPIAIGGEHLFFDTNTDNHQHLFDEEKRCLTDIPAALARLAREPRIPAGKRLTRVDIVLHVGVDK
jgi:Fur family transcriptional regulator, iron response regulator